MASSKTLNLELRVEQLFKPRTSHFHYLKKIIARSIKKIYKKRQQNTAILKYILLYIAPQMNSAWKKNAFLS